MHPQPLLSCALAWLALAAAPLAGEPLRFNRDIRPILSENCFHCHGQDAAQRKAKLRLDTAEGVQEGGVLVPGKPEESPLYTRLVTDDPEEKMPPPDSHRALTAEQIAKIRQWIEEGGAYETHWSFIPPQRHPLPAAGNGWARVPWDAWVWHHLEQHGLRPSPEAPPEMWLRRVSFDLTGLPPSSDEIAAFRQAVAERGEAAYAETVDRLLASPRFGERLAADWMDVARYADTHGFNNDSARSIWRWRDWIIEAFNRDLPYDRFLTLQLAGDLLPNPTLDDLIATGFCRNHVINSEGGIIDEEYRVEYVADRVRTLGQAWLGLTLECARCHDHKYDPISTKDYYQLFAFFNQVPEWGEDGRVANAAPIIPAPTPEQQEQLASLDRQLTVVRAELTTALADAPDANGPASAEEIAAWAARALAELHPPAPDVLVLGKTAQGWRNQLKPEEEFGKGARFAEAEDPQAGTTLQFPATEHWRLEPAQFGSLLAAAERKPWTLTATVRWEGGAGALLSSMNYRTPESSTSHADGIEVRLTEEGKLELRVSAKWPAYALQLRSVPALTPQHWHEIAVISRGGGKAAGYGLAIDGQECEVEVLHDGLTGGPGARPLTVGTNSEKTPATFHGQLASLAVASQTWDADQLAAAAGTAFLQRLQRFRPSRDELSATERQRLTTLARALHPATRELMHRTRALQAARLALQREFPSTMVMRELPKPRPTYVLHRGVYDAPTEPVSPGVPEHLLGPWPEGAPRNRLGLAQWLTQPHHPLTARVVVNRFWQELFGVGQVKTSEDFGFQGEYPLHPELLDMLARDFIDHGWSVKRLLREIVLSATYRQTSAAPPEAYAADPENRHLARGPRVRLAAEMIRDQALYVSGLLHERLGGPSVFPDQPPDLYHGVVVDAPYPGTKWVESEGPDRHRRSLYTFWKRTVPHPLLNVFDMPDREFGCTRRLRTNTPLQALALMNEPSLLRAAGHLGQRLLAVAGAPDDARLHRGFLLVTSRPPTDAEQAALARLLTQFRASFANDPEGARDLQASAGLPPAEDTPAAVVAEYAAWTSLAHALLNLDEALTKN